MNDGTDMQPRRPDGSGCASAVLAVAGQCLELAEAGLPPAALGEQDYGLILRAREEAGTPEEVAAREQEMLSRLKELRMP